jgi:hypothetical protein
MKMKKVDLSGVKDFLFQKGERVGLVVCGVIGLALLGMGLMKAGGASTPYAADFKKARTAKDSQLNNQGGGELPPIKNPEVGDEWADRRDSFNNTPLSAISEGDDNKRRNPDVLDITMDGKHVTVDFVRGGYISFGLEKDQAWVVDGEKTAQAAFGRPGTAGEHKLAKIMKPLRAVVVSAVFPMRAQILEFQRKLRYASVAELEAVHADMPRPLGLNVFRCEKKPDGKFTDWELIFKHDAAEDKLEVAPRIDNLIREAVLDEETPKLFGYHYYPGLVTPLPLLAHQQYPKLRFEGIKEEDGTTMEKQPRGMRTDPPGRRPPAANIFQKRDAANPAANEPEVKFKLVRWADLPEWQDKFTGKIDFFDPSGIVQENEVNPGVPTPVPSRNPRVTFKRKRPPVQQKKKEGASDDKDLVDSIIRFMDVDVVPGKTYVYTFQVRMANPNFGKPDDVAFQELAETKELPPSGFATTPPITIPDEYFFYAVNQYPERHIPEGSDDPKRLPAKADAEYPYYKWTTTVQIHRWLGKLIDSAGLQSMADWVIAERLLVRRGDPIGRFKVMVEVPVWSKAKEDFEIGFQVQQRDAKGKEGRADTGLPINFIREQDTNNPPLLVDFEGGVKHNVKVGKEMLVRDESAVDMLVLGSDGKLVVRNSRVDTDLQERHERYEKWIEGIRRLRNENAPAPTPGVIAPRKKAGG